MYIVKKQKTDAFLLQIPPHVSLWKQGTGRWSNSHLSQFKVLTVLLYSWLLPFQSCQTIQLVVAISISFVFIYTVTFIPHIIIGGWLSKPIKLSVRCSDAPRSSARCYGCYGKATPLLMQVIIIYVSILGNICHKQSIFHPCSYIGYVQLGFMDIFRYSSTILLS